MEMNRREDRRRAAWAPVRRASASPRRAGRDPEGPRLHPIWATDSGLVAGPAGLKRPAALHVSRGRVRYTVHVGRVVWRPGYNCNMSQSATTFTPALRSNAT